MVFCDNCLSVCLTGEKYCSYCGRDMRTNNFEPLDLTTEKDQKRFTRLDKERRRRIEGSSERGDIEEVRSYVEELSEGELFWLFESVGGNVRLSRPQWLSRSIIGYPIHDILDILDGRGYDTQELRSKIWVLKEGADDN